MSVALEDVRVEYGATAALEGVTCAFRAGERVAIIGPSGAGKTTLLKVLSTALRPTAGRVHILGEDPWGARHAALRRLRSRIGMVHQSPPLPPRQRVVTSVLAGRLGHWPAWKSLLSLAYPADVRGAQRMLDRLEIADKLFARCGELSGGQLQRVGVARVLYQRPDLILTDEPVSALDPALSDRIVGELNREALDRGITLIASLHAVDLALRWFPRVIGIRGGRVMFDLPPVRVRDELLADLYATEGAQPPTQDNRPLALPQPGVRRRPLCS